ncbi:caspase family protein, partial [filamentous cyanobacterium LEGE 11480]
MPQAHALVVGVSEYQQINPLGDAVRRDAQAIYDVLIDPLLCGYPQKQVSLLIDGATTGDGLRQAFGKLAQDCDQDSTVLIYFSGHGGRVEAGDDAGEYLLPVDVQWDNAANMIVPSSAIAGTELTEMLRSIPARKLVVVFDCCHAGGIGQAKDGSESGFKVGLPDRYYDKLKTGRGRVILASSRDTELSWILRGAENSLFTQHLVAG